MSEEQQQPPQNAQGTGDVAGDNWGVNVGVNMGTINVPFSTGTVPLPPPRVPPPVEDFFGRQKEVEDLAAYLVEVAHPPPAQRRGGICRVRGMPGIGKTQLALKVIEQVCEHFPDGQIMVDLRGTSARPLRRAQAVHSVLRAFLPTYPYTDDVPAMQAVLEQQLANKRVLILADDVARVEQVEAFVPPAGCALIVTTRLNLTIRSRQKAVTLGRLAPDDAHALLLDICPRIGEHAPTLATLCDRLPLALRLSASYVQSHEARSLESYLHDLHQRRAEVLQTDTHPDLADDAATPEATAGIVASVALSYATLNDVEQQMFGQLAVFVSDFDEAAAAAVLAQPTDAVERVLATLEHTSLLEFAPTTRRYAMPALVRDVASTYLQQTDEETAIHLRYARYFADLVRHLHELTRSSLGGMVEALRRFDQERPHIGEGWRWAREHDPPTEASDTLQMDYGLATMTLGSLRYHPEYERIEQYQGMLAAARRRNRPNRVGVALHNLGNAYAALGDYYTAIDYHQQNLAICREIGNQLGEGIALGHLGEMYAELGDYQQALTYHQQNLELARAIGNVRGESIALGNLGYTLSLTGKPHEALQRHAEQLVLVRQHGDHYGAAVAQSRMGLAWLHAGDLPQARALLEEALTLAEDLAARTVEGRVYDRLGQVAAAQGDLSTARVHYERSLELAREMGDRGAEARTRWRLGQLLVQQGRRAQGIAELQQAVALEQALRHTDAATHAAALAELQEQG